MEPESNRRITPKNALAHPFLKEAEEPDDDEFVPHRFAEGVCGRYHFFDEVTNEPCVRIRKRKKTDEEEDEGEEEREPIGIPSDLDLDPYSEDAPRSPHLVLFRANSGPPDRSIA